jgi:trehalose 6-phosphate phosphatase
MDRCLRRIRDAWPVALFLDYDGTLVDLQPIPAAALLEPGKKRVLAGLARKAPLAFVSGRARAELTALIGVEGAGYIGNHGLEMRWPGGEWLHRRAQAARPELALALDRLREKTWLIPGVLLENKGLSASVHYRCTPVWRRQALKRLVQREIARHAGSLRLVPGKMVWEFRPQVRWDKGLAVKRYAALTGIRRTIPRLFIGDDQTDEDAFRALRPMDIGIVVGSRKRSAAEFRRRDVQAVWRLLDSLNRLA